MNWGRAILGISTLFLGPAFSLGLGGIAYLELDMHYGANGANSEAAVTQDQRFYSSLAEPAFVCISVSGIVLSLWIVYLTLPKR